MIRTVMTEIKFKSGKYIYNPDNKTMKGVVLDIESDHEIWKQMVAEYQPRVTQKKAWGRLMTENVPLSLTSDYTPNSVIQLTETSHYINSLKIVENKIIVEIQILKTPNGLILVGLLEQFFLDNGVIDDVTYRMLASICYQKDISQIFAIDIYAGLLK